MGMVFRMVEVQLGQALLDRNVTYGFSGSGVGGKTTKETKEKNQLYQYFPRPQLISTKYSMWEIPMIAGAERKVLFHDYHYWNELYCARK